MTDNLPENVLKGSKLAEAIRTKSIVLDSVEYQSECRIIDNIFRRSREVRNPIELVNIQEEVFENILSLQERKSKSTDDLEEVLYKLSITANRSIVDSIAWRLTSYDRFFMQLMISHNQTGALNAVTSRAELKIAKKYADEGSWVVLCDLTHGLRFGDMLKRDSNGIELIEVKDTPTGKAKDSRVLRQKQVLNRVNNFLKGKTETLQLDQFEHYVVSNSEFPVISNHEYLRKAIADARKEGYGIQQVTPFLVIEVFDRKVEISEDMKSKIVRPMADNKEYNVTFNSIMPFNNYPALASSAPYGIWPIDVNDRIDLITQQLALRVTLDIKRLQNLYASVGLELTKAKQEESEKKQFTEAVFESPTGSRDQKLLEEAGFLSYFLWDPNASLGMKLEQSHFASMIIDLLDPLGVVYQDKAKIDLVKKLIDDKKFELGKSNLHLRVNESSLWVS